MKNTRRGESELGFIVSILAIVAVGLIVGTEAHGCGHRQGVRDGIAGRYVVVQLPDGTSVVVEVKPTPKEPHP